ncbi:hypothetical protein DERF_009729 [Dermatophagoides farinae]|uniref:Uncharacterized protein n=1 Tax=Dermatophagoides farinae TaxID=6954 RepID=A0A922HZR9_DERFA|nr:hypothetical protein DERF_009729 [Dermatophagoides farinae]
MVAWHDLYLYIVDHHHLHHVVIVGVGSRPDRHQSTTNDDSSHGGKCYKRSEPLVEHHHLDFRQPT